jgi:hypothetical protein
MTQYIQTINVSEKYTSPIFKAQVKTASSYMTVTTYPNTQCHIPEVSTLKYVERRTCTYRPIFRRVQKIAKSGVMPTELFVSCAGDSATVGGPVMFAVRSPPDPFSFCLRSLGN